MYESITSNLMVESVDKAVVFYQDLLKFKVIVSVPGKNDEAQFAIIMKDGITLMLQQRSNMMEEFPVLKTEKVSASISLYISVDDLEKLHGEIKNTHPIYQDLHTSFYGAKEFSVLDVDGYVLVFTEKKK